MNSLWWRLLHKLWCKLPTKVSLPVLFSSFLFSLALSLLLRGNERVVVRLSSPIRVQILQWPERNEKKLFCTAVKTDMGTRFFQPWFLSKQTQPRTLLAVKHISNSDLASSSRWYNGGGGGDWSPSCLQYLLITVFRKRILNNGS